MYSICEWKRAVLGIAKIIAAQFFKQENRQIYFDSSGKEEGSDASKLVRPIDRPDLVRWAEKLIEVLHYYATTKSIHTFRHRARLSAPETKYRVLR